MGDRGENFVCPVRSLAQKTGYNYCSVQSLGWGRIVKKSTKVGRKKQKSLLQAGLDG
jgi:hypothetical protein